MEIIIGNVPLVKKDPEKKPKNQKDSGKGFLRDRRKNKVDRRRANREGIIVNLSVKNDRRVNPDRRKK